MRRVDLTAEAADVGEAEVVAQHDDDVRRALRRGGTRRPPWLGRRNSGRDPPFESVIRQQRRVAHWSPRFSSQTLGPSGPRRSGKRGRPRAQRPDAEAPGRLARTQDADYFSI